MFKHKPKGTITQQSLGLGLGLGRVIIGQRYMSANITSRPSVGVFQKVQHHNARAESQNLVDLTNSEQMQSSKLQTAHTTI